MGAPLFFRQGKLSFIFFLTRLLKIPQANGYGGVLFQIAHAIYRLVHNLGCCAQVLFQKRGIEWRPVAPINECMAEFLKKL